MSAELRQMTNEIGQPTSLESDPRSGIAAVWGSRDRGAFSISRGPIDTDYEVVLKPSKASGRQAEKHTLTAAQLNEFFTQNLQQIKNTLAGQ